MIQAEANSWYLLTMNLRLGVVIATRNRPTKLGELFKSLIDSSFVPTEVIVVSSGENISNLISEFSTRFKIKHSHIEEYGQVRQKILGISLVSEATDWVLFLDDDLVLDKKALSECADYISANAEAGNVVGVGLDLEQTSKLKDSSMLKRRIAKVFFLNGKPGQILRSGHPVAYLGSPGVTKTQWLIGVSMWRREILNHYGVEFLDSKYSAFEDVIFSYKCLNFGDLMYLPQSKLFFQDDSVTEEGIEVFTSATYWRFYFVHTNREDFSFLAFFWSQIGRSIFFLFGDVSKGIAFPEKLRTVSAIYLELIYQVLVKKDPIWSLNRHCRLESGKNSSV